MGSREEQGDPQAVGRQLIAVAAWDAFDDSVKAKPAQIVCHPACGVIRWIDAQHLRQQQAHFLIVESPQLETEHSQHGE